MKANFKPLSLAAAVATATAGYAGVSHAQNQFLPSNGLGDLAIVPYYTVQDDWGTGVHVINTSNNTQVVKIRLRRGNDSLDALDFNLVMSPYDHWTGFVNDSEEGGEIKVTSQDTTCSAPLKEAGGWTMDPLYRDGADEGYIEVIAMGQAEFETAAIALNAVHVDGTPVNCAYVEENFFNFFFKPADKVGVTGPSTTVGRYDNPLTKKTEILESTYVDSPNVLKVSWFIRDGATGIEFGDDAYHVGNFEYRSSMITNQEFGIFAGDLSGFDFPDLNGTAPAWGNFATSGGSSAGLDKFNFIRQAFGVTAVLNDWSDNPDLSVGTDWVVTMPGQYSMLDLPEYLASLADEDNECPSLINDDWEGEDDEGEDGGCDQRDIPVTASFSIWDREEELLTAPGDRDIVVSPSIPGQIPRTELKYEVNVIHWAPERKVLDSDYAIEVDTSLLEQVSGWAKLAVSPQAAPGADPTDPGDKIQAICLWNEEYAAPFGYRPGIDPADDLMSCLTVSEGDVPMVGFVAWERSFPENPDGNYGRAIRHSFESDD